MTECRLKYKDENGEEKHVAVNAGIFTIGRHSSSSLAIADNRLSREHVRIERDGGDFVVSDPGSSNGTTLNGRDLFDAAVLKNGDNLNLGGVEIMVEIASGYAAVEDLPVPPSPEPPILDTGFAPSMPVTPSVENSSIPMSFFIIAPILGIIVLVLVGGIIFLFSSTKNDPDPADGDDIVYSKSDDDIDKPEKKVKNTSTIKSQETTEPGSPSNSGTAGTTGQPAQSPQNLTDAGKVEQSGATFLRKIAQNDPRAFLTGEQAQRVNAKVKNLSKSTLADNINAARKNSAQISTLAASKNLKPQFLAVAAITKLGSSRGDIMQAAQGIADVYDKLGTQIGSEFADETLLMVAAYDQGAAGDFMKLRNMLQDLANKSPESARAIRTIWFLEKNGKITSAEFDYALNFLAIGTITQNPKDFGVNVEALNL